MIFICAMNTESINQAGEFVNPLYRELRKLAHARVRRLPPGQSVQTTDLVHEAYIRLSRNPKYRWQNERHFYGAAAKAMREIIFDRVRSRKAFKRGGDQVRVDLITMPDQPGPLTADTLVSLHAVLQRMQVAMPEHAELVHLHFFAGLPLAEVARVMGMGLRTVERRWRAARAWLRAQIVD